MTQAHPCKHEWVKDLHILTLLLSQLSEWVHGWLNIRKSVKWGIDGCSELEMTVWKQCPHRDRDLHNPKPEPIQMAIQSPFSASLYGHNLLFLVEFDSYVLMLFDNTYKWVKVTYGWKWL